VMPAYRNIIQSKDPRKEIVVEGRIEDTSLSSELSVLTQVFFGGQSDPVWQKTVEHRPGERYGEVIPVESWAEGKYRIDLSIMTSDSEVAGRKSFEVDILPANRFEVTFDDRRVCY